MKKSYAIIFFMGLQTSLFAQKPEKITLATLSLENFGQEVFAPVTNQSMTGGKMKMAEKTFENGISVHAPSIGHLVLQGKAKRFIADIGVDDKSNRKVHAKEIESLAKTDGSKIFYYKHQEKNTLIGVGKSVNEIPNGSVVFKLIGDGKELYSSGILKQGDAPQHIDVPIEGIQFLTLSVTDAGDGNGGDVANWSNAYIISQTGAKPAFISESAILKEQKSEPIDKKLADEIAQLPLHQASVAQEDWLIRNPDQQALVSREGNNQVILSNGLVSRTLYLSSNIATISLKNLLSNEEFIRAAEPEAKVTIDGRHYDVGGLTGQVDKGYLLADWLKNMSADPTAFSLNHFEVKNIVPSIKWNPKRWLPSTQWKTGGKELILSFTHPRKKGVIVKVHHQIYNGIPLVSKYLTIENHTGKPIHVEHFTGEIIAFPEAENASRASGDWIKPNFHIENNYAFGGMSYEQSTQSIRWETDSSYTSQADYGLKTICLVKSEPTVGPSQIIKNGDSWKSFDTYTLLFDGTDRERNTLSQRKMYRMLAPWSTENPIFMHLTSTKPEVVKQAVDQCVETGYEMVILSFGSGFNIEDQSQINLDKYKQLAAYAHNKGIQIGGYSLFSSRSIDDKNDVINIKTGKPGGTTFGNAPCMGSEWGIAYLNKLKNFFEYTDFDLLEHDGPFPGDFCASTVHPGHKGYEDSQWKQWKQSTDLYQWLQEQDIYSNVPDFYILSGSNKTGIGYREVNWSLPRAQQIILGRQNIFDATWSRTPSMGWTFVPLTEYHGGGAAATLEPLSEHLPEYSAHMVQNYGAGIQACYRGNRLYDKENTKELVKKEIAHYKKYRDILNADVVHLRRPDGRDWDGFMHVDPLLKQKGYALFFNPLSATINRKIKIPLYYTGLKKEAKISINGKPSVAYTLDNKGCAEVELNIPANGYTWLVVESL